MNQAKAQRTFQDISQMKVLQQLELRKGLGELSHLFIFAKQHGSYSELVASAPMQSHTHSHCERCLGRGGQGGVVAIWARNNVSIPNHGRQNPVACSCLPSNLSPPHPTGFTPATLRFRCSRTCTLVPTSGPLHSLLALPGALFPQMFAWFAL